MEPEQAFTRRAAGVNPIALELERLAQLKALGTLGRRRGGSAPSGAGLVPTDAMTISPEDRAMFLDAKSRDPSTPMGIDQPLPERENIYASLYGRQAAARQASGPAGVQAELDMLSTPDLASSAQMASDWLSTPQSGSDAASKAQENLAMLEAWKQRQAAERAAFGQAFQR